MEAQASSLLADMSALHGQLKEQQTMSARGLFDIPTNEGGWERPLPPSTGPRKAAPPPSQPKPSDLWKPTSSPPKNVEVPKPQVAPSKPESEHELAMPSFWKPSWDGEFTEPPTPQVPPISRLATVQDVPDEDGASEPAAPAPTPKNAKQTPVPAHQPTSAKSQVPTVAEEPTPVWGQPWRKGQSCFLPADDSSLTAWQQGNHPFLTHRQTKPRSLLSPLPRYPPLSKNPLLHHRSLLPFLNLSLHLLQLSHQRRPNPRQPNSLERRRTAKGKTRQQRQ